MCARAGTDVHVCVRVCMYHVIMNVCTCARMYLCMSVLMHECTYVHNPNPHAHSPAHRNRHHLSHLPSRPRPVRDCVRVCQAHVCVRARVRVRARVSGGCPRVRMCAPRPCVSHRSLGCRPNIVHSIGIDTRHEGDPCAWMIPQQLNRHRPHRPRGPTRIPRPIAGMDVGLATSYI